jgi:hypothetical protein
MSDRQESRKPMSPMRLLGLWVQRNMTTCQFAARLMKEKKLYLVEGGAHIERLNAVLDQAGERGLACMIFYPRLEREEHLVDILHQFCSNARWRGEILTNAPVDGPAIRVDWHTAEGKWSNCLGTAPLLSMPVPRRSPYVALTLWPGPAPSKARDRSRLGITDIPSPCTTRAQHDKLLATTKDDVARVFGSETKPWRDITFCLDARYRELVGKALKS